MLGFDHEGLAAVAVAGLGDAPNETIIEGIAIASRRRREDGALANEAAEIVTDWAIERAMEAGYEEVTLTARVHPSNTASRRLLERHHYVCREADDEGQTWQITWLI